MTVNVNKQPIPYAQISVFVFEDNSPTNGAVDGNEPGLGGFEITLEDAGGRYGISAGTMSQDAVGNPLKNSLACFGGSPPPGRHPQLPGHQANREAGLVGQVLIKNLFPGSTALSRPRRGSGLTGHRPRPSRAPRSSTPGSRPTSRLLPGVRPGRLARVRRLREP